MGTAILLHRTGGTPVGFHRLWCPTDTNSSPQETPGDRRRAFSFCCVDDSFPETTAPLEVLLFVPDEGELGEEGSSSRCIGGSSWGRPLADGLQGNRSLQ
jgi:hypothetical protein